MGEVLDHPTTEAQRSPEAAQQLVLDIIGTHADSLLHVARRHSLCLDDAQDAYQRAIEILIRHSARLEADGAAGWTHTVVKHEAMRLRAQRTRIVGSEEVDLDAHEARHLPDAEDRVIAFDRLSRSAEALQRLKPQEIRALWLKAQGLSYQEIAEVCGWSYTKVNRCITEGRRSFLARYAGIERGEECERWAPVLSALVDGEASADELARARPHLRNCAACRATVRELHEAGRAVAALLPLPLVAASEMPDRAAAAGGLLARAWDLLVGPLHERAAMSATKIQTAIEATATGKATAIAASAAAIAGGGVAVDRTVVHRGPERPAAARAAKAPAQAPPASPARIVARADTVKAATASRSPSSAQRSATRSTHEAKTASREFGVSSPTAATASASNASAAAGSREFAPKASSASSGATAADTSPTSSPEAEQATTEFGP